ncbi:MAG: histidine-type phosphatase [Betaproteobacteria bacterium]|nr:histidine-type phosphatase [Betaproteobacteria bacterium]NDA24659.1 histidine-type phosphatase [Betaproteobacteria bacterium]NDB98936.1 histidine-type phosphatase [Betaproteobacteria bacterium]NDC69879.1 histidine-type phosphatase [Betaproteobacteria bacterium]
MSIRVYLQKRALPSFLLLTCTCIPSTQVWSAGHYTTKTPYQPQQQATTYEAVPAGFAPIHTQLLARHGSRAMSGLKDDLAFLNLWRLALQQGALTPKAERLGPQLEKLIEANALMGYGLLRYSQPGYGNLSLRGMQEHEGLAQRMLQRLPELFAQIEQSASDSGQVPITVQHSGVNRARDSAQSFVNALILQKPGLKAAVDPRFVMGHPDDTPRHQAQTVNRFLLYFHRLNAGVDGVGLQASDPKVKILESSQRYQTYSKSFRVTQKIDAIQNSDVMRATAFSVLLRLFKPEFLMALDRGKVIASNTGTLSVTSKDGLYSAHLKGDGRTQIRTPVQALLALSSVYEIAPGLQRELGFDFDEYFQPEEAKVLAEANDAEDFYTKGPGIAEDEPVNHAMAEGLLNDFFEQINHAHKGRFQASASLRFTHAEILIPFASLLKIAGLTDPLALNQTYAYSRSTWRGELIAPYAANLQWDTYRNPDGLLIVRMLYNEKETLFKPQCDPARFHPHSYFYEFKALMRCYLS